MFGGPENLGTPALGECLFQSPLAHLKVLETHAQRGGFRAYLEIVVGRIHEEWIAKHGMQIESEVLPLLQGVALGIPFAVFCPQLVYDRLKFALRTIKTVVINLIEPWSNCWRGDDRVEHLRPPWPTVRKCGTCGSHYGDVIEILVVVIVVTDVEARRCLRHEPYIVVDLPIRALAEFHADAANRNVVVNLVVRCAVVEIQSPT